MLIEESKLYDLKRVQLLKTYWNVANQSQAYVKTGFKKLAAPALQHNGRINFGLELHCYTMFRNRPN